MRSFHAALRVRLVRLLALSMSLVVGVPKASAQLGPNLWSIQLDGGLFAPIQASGASPTLGMRYCKHYTPYLQGGLRTGFALKTDKLDAPASGPQVSEPLVELARFDALLVPVMGFVQVNFTERSRLVPFAGIGAGYEWLTLYTKDHQTGQDSKVTYGNVAWEAFGGLGLRLNSLWRVNWELFYNGGSLERSVPDATGSVLREAVNVNGVGARFGVDMVFD